MKIIRPLLYLFLLTGSLVYSEIKDYKRFRLELFGGYSALNPADLNLKAASLRQRFDLAYSDYYSFLNKIHYINSYTQSREGEFRSLKQVFPLGVRLKYHICKPLAFSLGFKYLSQTETSFVSEQFNIVENNGRESFDSYEFSPFVLSVGGYVPNFGIHFGLNFVTRLRMEAFVSAGPIFSDCSLSYPYHIERYYGDSDISTESEYFLEMKGKGRGLALETGLQISLAVGSNVSLFLEGGYAFQKVNHLSGPGKEDDDGFILTWEGYWIIKEYVIYRPWGNVTRTWPSNYWKGEEHLKIRDFELDLSGWQVRLGIAYNF